MRGLRGLRKGRKEGMRWKLRLNHCTLRIPTDFSHAFSPPYFLPHTLSHLRVLQQQLDEGRHQQALCRRGGGGHQGLPEGGREGDVWRKVWKGVEGCGGCGKRLPRWPG